MVWGVSLLLQVLLTIQFFNSRGLSILVYVGFTLFLIFLIMGWMARVEFSRKGGIRKGDSLIRTTVLVDSGIYSIVRHPMYASWIVLSLSLLLLSQCWISAILCAIVALFLSLDARKEDASLTLKFGEEYKDYMKRVPRINFLLGFLRLRTRSYKPH